jgi:hypothetical protein
MTTDWAPFGEAFAEMPALFAHLRGKKTQARRYARDRLVDLCGPAAGATAPAAAALPTLLELLTVPDVQEREGLLLVLADLAAGGLHPHAGAPAPVRDQGRAVGPLARWGPRRGPHPGAGGQRAAWRQAIAGARGGAGPRG